MNIGCENMGRMLSKLDTTLFFTTIFLFIVGLIMIFSASTIESFMRYGTSPHHFFIRQAIFLIAGFIAFMFVINIPLKKYHTYVWFGIYGLLLSLFFLLAYGQAINSSFSWIRIGNLFSIQPSEFAKTILILLMASFYYRNINKLDNYVTALTPPIIGFIIVVFVMFQPDFGTSVIISLIVFLIFILTPINSLIKMSVIKIIIGMILVGLVVMLISGKTFFSGTQMDRLNFIRPCSRFETSGYHVCNGYIAINNGGLFGVGLGNSTQKYLYLPDVHTDFIFAIVLEELGLLITLFIMFLFSVVLYRILAIARKSTNLMESIIAYGVLIYIFLHIIINLTGLLGMLPLTGVPLPFFSYGGSYSLNLFVALGLVQRVHIESNKKTLNKKEI